VRDFLTGVRYFGRGLGLLARRPKLLLIGVLPAAATAAILLGALIALIANLGHLSALVTPFAAGWPGGWRTAARAAAGLALAATAVSLGLVGFTAMTLIAGGPFYEHIAERIEDDLGVTQGRAARHGRKLFLLGARDGIVLLLRSLMFSVVLFLAGFLPVAGQTVVPVLGALVTAWFMALEVVAVPFSRRGIGLRRRTAMLRRRRMLAVGLGLPAALLCLIPLAAIVVMPVAFAGGVLVALDVLGLAQPGRAPRRRPRAVRARQALRLAACRVVGREVRQVHIPVEGAELWAEDTGGDGIPVVLIHADWTDSGGGGTELGLALQQPGAARALALVAPGIHDYPWPGDDAFYRECS
jgi:CysZ protein